MNCQNRTNLTFFTVILLCNLFHPEITEVMREKPKLIVFDLDYTLWPFWVDTHVNPPFRKLSNGTIVDSYGAKITCYPEVPEVLENVYNEGYILGVASRTSEIAGAQQLMELFGWNKYFTHKQIFPGKKVTHFNNIKRDSRINFDQMIFFDDEHRNIQDLTRHGVTSIYVRNGVTKKVVEEGISQFMKERV